MTSEELTAAITEFRKETEDLAMSIVVDAFNILYGTASATVGTISVALSVPYDSVDDYEVRIFSAVDADGTNIVDALTIDKATISGFTIESPVAGTVKWQTARRSPKLDLWTA